MGINKLNRYQPFSEYLKYLTDLHYQQIEEKDVNSSATIFFSAIEKDTHKKILIKRFTKELDKYHEFEIESYTLENLDHDNIIKPIAIFEDSEYGYIVFPYAEGGDLFDLIYSRNIQFDNEQLKIIAYSLISALDKIHSKGYIYRDIKFENIVLRRNINDMQKEFDTDDIVLIDFGSCYVDSISENLYDFRGTSFYQAPEYIYHRKVTEKYDIFSLGILLYYLVTSYLPFDINYDYDEFEFSMIFSENNISDLFTGNEWSGFSSGIKELIQSMLLFDDRARASTQELLKNDLFSNLLSPYDLAHEYEDY